MKKKSNFLNQLFLSEQYTGILLICCVIFSIVIANSVYNNSWISFLDTKIGFESIHLSYPLTTWINDGLMAVFFLLIGLEIKREILEGELSSFKIAILPVLAALGGMLFPAVIYSAFNYGKASSIGWGIPMATDIAFALAILSLLGKNIPASLKIFLATLAIADDLGAILVIAIFYTAEIHWEYLLFGLVVLGFLFFLNKKKVNHLSLYLIPGLLLWYLLHRSGIHATIAGVLTAFTIPLNKSKNTSPLKNLEHQLVKPVHLFILPIFALANTNIEFGKDMFAHLFTNIGLGIFFGLFFGKTIGVTFFSWLAVKLKWSMLPNGITWKHILGLGILSGIGFTMSIFIGLLSFTDPNDIAIAKFSILSTSFFTAITGFCYLKIVSKQ